MLVDMQMAKPQTDYKRDQLSKSFKSGRRSRKSLANRTPWLALRARKPSVA